MDLQSGEYGMSTLSSKPISSTKILPLPKGKYEPRSSIIHEVFITEDNIITFVNVHFDWIDGPEGINNRLRQAKALIEYINGLDQPCIIAGDFNCTPDSPTMKYFKKQGFLFSSKGDDNLSFQGENPSEIDHVIYRNSKNLKFQVKNVVLLEEPLVSDHRPLIVEMIAVIN